MREAALKAGIDGDRLMLAFESEVAAVWCTRNEITDHQVSDLRSTGAKYMVIDLGGGTADITVHEKNSNDSFKIIHKANGGAWGGHVVDEQFLGYLEKLYGKSVFNEFRRQNINDFFELIR
ncbi:hypothetical protein DPMN_029941 [Dreissena polymorpha]|uniref:Heat shock protein 70 n=1 Tax=Dreissena polymorpha TaxID=45954 RepID=A0A9D4RGN9_DREPO|nr:hypothetical protein DPMN_029941 [Dreissena polymorpha]